MEGDLFNIDETENELVEEEKLIDEEAVKAEETA